MNNCQSCRPGPQDAPDKSRGAGLQPAKNVGKTAGYKPAPRPNRTIVGRVLENRPTKLR